MPGKDKAMDGAKLPVFKQSLNGSASDSVKVNIDTNCRFHLTLRLWIRKSPFMIVIVIARLGPERAPESVVRSLSRIPKT